MATVDQSSTAKQLDLSSSDLKVPHRTENFPSLGFLSSLAKYCAEHKFTTSVALGLLALSSTIALWSKNSSAEANSQLRADHSAIASATDTGDDTKFVLKHDPEELAKSFRSTLTEDAETLELVSAPIAADPSNLKELSVSLESALKRSFDIESTENYFKHSIYGSIAYNLTSIFRTGDCSELTLELGIRNYGQRESAIGGSSRSDGLGTFSTLNAVLVKSGVNLPELSEGQSNVTRDLGLFSFYMSTSQLSPEAENDLNQFDMVCDWVSAELQDCAAPLTSESELRGLIVNTLKAREAESLMAGSSPFWQQRVVDAIAREINDEFDLGITLSPSLPLSSTGNMYHTEESYETHYWSDRGRVEHCSAELEYICSLLKVNAETLITHSEAGREILNQLDDEVTSVTILKYLSSVGFELKQRYQEELPDNVEFVYDQYASEFGAIADLSKDDLIAPYFDHFSAEYFAKLRTISDGGSLHVFKEDLVEYQREAGIPESSKEEALHVYRRLSILARQNPSFLVGQKTITDQEIAVAHHRWNGHTQLRLDTKELLKQEQGFSTEALPAVLRLDPETLRDAEDVRLPSRRFDERLFFDGEAI